MEARTGSKKTPRSAKLLVAMQLTHRHQFFNERLEREDAAASVDMLACECEGFPPPRVAGGDLAFACGHCISACKDRNLTMQEVEVEINSCQCDNIKARRILLPCRTRHLYSSACRKCAILLITYTMQTEAP